MIAYCFAEKVGYSKFGVYTGNSNADGPFVYTGFKPAWVMVKVTNDGDNWHIIDNKRDSFNTMDSHLFANLNTAETTSSSYNFDMLSNGFKPRSTNNAFNASGKPYIYMAFAEQPLLGTNNIPSTARWTMSINRDLANIISGGFTSIESANQASGSKEAYIRGVSLQF